MICPCKNCICLPVCKHKRYLKLVDGCTLITKYFPVFQSWTKRPQKKLLTIYNTIGPTKWSISYRYSSYKTYIWILEKY